jgi:hypothetical protein
VRDAHHRVVGGVGQRVERLPVGADEDVVLHVGRVECDLAAYEVFERVVLVGHLEADDRLTTLGFVRRDLLGCEVTVEAVVTAGPAGRTSGVAALLELLGAVVCLVGKARVEQSLGDIGVDVHALGLAIGAVRAADLRALVPVEAEPPHDVDQELVGILSVAGGVGVLDAEHERPAVMARERPAEQRRARHADVRVAGRRGAEPGDDRTISHGTPPGWSGCRVPRRSR